MALGGAACAAMVMVMIRILSRTDEPVTLIAYQGIGVGLLVLPLAIYFWKTPTLPELVLLLMIGGVSVFAQMGNILAFRAGEASSVAPVEYVRLIYAVAIGFFVFGHWPEPSVFIGAAIIIGAAVYTIQREARLGKKQMAVEREGTGGLPR
jgi:drug/metabolite transporter (DMT)-like permease